ncbi:MAG: hypothetical protein H6766_07720 [Candidatus Peribacteria bacterium]|nr:MAG: hypothetical protein H6766_07720 [Candidatus Peribacteria bacterium]
MKKLAALSAVAILSITGVTGIFAQDENIFEYIDDAVQVTSTDANFGFNTTDIVQAIDATDTTLTIVAPIVYDGSDPILEYDVSYAGAPRADLEANNSTDQIETVSCTFVASELEGKQEIECDLNVGTDIQAEQTYYLTIFPRKNGLLGTPSEEISFNYQDIYDNRNTTDTTDTTHSAAPDMCAANISRSQDNDKVTVTRDALVNSGKVRLEARGESESAFRTIGTADLTAEQFVFTPSQAGTYLIKLVPLDANDTEYGKACTQTMHLEDFAVTAVNTQTGPKETLMIIGLIAVIGGYLLLKRKH